MIVDSSALLAILLKEADAGRYADAMSETAELGLAAPTLVESALAAEGRGGETGRAELDRLIGEAGIEVIAFTAEHAAAAREAWRRFGRGRHPASLNLGDCFAYALAAVTGRPLLSKGGNFALTDVKAAL